MDQLQRWLVGVGLEQLAPVFESNDVDMDVLVDLTEADLEKIGISLGLRKKLLKALEQLRCSQAIAQPAFVDAAKEGAAERRQLTVMFCDLVGSTALSVQLDPEELRDVLHSYQASVAAEVARFEGHLAKYLGDGVLAYFGWPRAHEHEAERAVRAGLAAIEAVNALPMPPGVVLSARVGIATGLVVVSEKELRRSQR